MCIIILMILSEWTVLFVSWTWLGQNTGGGRAWTINCICDIIAIWKKHRGCDYIVTWRKSNVWRSYDIQVRREKSIRRCPLSYSSRSTLMTHTDRSSSAASSQTHLSGSSEKASSPQFAAGCFRVRGTFITCGIDVLHVNDILCCAFLSK